MPAVTESTNYIKLRKALAEADNLANLSPYNPVVREIMMDFKPTNINQDRISLAAIVTYYIKFATTLRYIGV
jgi:hypothetical protein